MTFFHHSMTDAELTRAADATENPFLRMVSERLAERRAQLATIAQLSEINPDTPPTGDECMDRLERVNTISRA
jgi:ribosomal protein L18E